MNCKFCVGLGIHLFILSTCLTTTVLMTLLKSFVNYYQDEVNKTSSVAISGYNIQPDIPVAAHVLLLALGKAWKDKIRIVHLVFAVVGIVAVCVLIFPQASAFTDVNCWLEYNVCKCGRNSVDASNNVCACREIRIAYFFFLLCGFVGLLLSLGVVAKLIPVKKPCGATKVGQDAGNTIEATNNSTVPPISHLSSQNGPGTTRQEGED